MRIGHGYDVHKFAPDRKLILGGACIPYEYGLLGHSDADVLTHALCDAILGALALGDIGKHFPDNSEKFKGINSLILLSDVCKMAKEKGYIISNADCTIIAQKPKLAGYIETMRKNIAETIKCDISQISIKATTEEGLGFTGSLLGISAHSVVLMKRTEA